MDMDMGMSMEREKTRPIPERTRPSGRLARELSLWALLARGSIYKILAILIIMVAGECTMFARSLMRWMGQDRLTDMSFETIFEDGGFKVWFLNGYAVLFLAAFCLIFVVLLRCEAENGGSRFGYTLGRLRVSMRHLYLVRTAYNFLCFCLLFAVQIWVVLWMCRLYSQNIPEEVLSPQFTFLAFYRIPFLHNLLPLAETAKWGRNLLAVLALSAELAVCLLHRQFSAYWSMLLLMMTGFAVDIGFHWPDLMLYFAFSVVLLAAVLRIFGIWKDNADIREP